MITSPDELRKQEMTGMARRNPELFNELWEKGVYDPANNVPDFSEVWNFFAKRFKKVIAIFKRRKKQM